MIAMIFVNTNKETALQRNSTRDRDTHEMVSQMWQEVQDNIGKFRPFGNLCMCRQLSRC